MGKTNLYLINAPRMKIVHSGFNRINTQGLFDDDDDDNETNDVEMNS